MRFCAAFGCNNGSRSEENRRHVKSNNISFHPFPMNDKKRLKAWTERVGRANFMPTKYSNLCSEHFREEDFRYQPFTNRRFIKETAVPSKFPHKQQTPKRKRTSYVFAESVIVEPEESPAKETSTQTELTMEDIEALEHKNKEQHNLIDVYEERLKTPSFSADKMSDSYLKRFTGFSACMFSTIFRFFCLDEHLSSHGLCAQSPLNVFFMTLLRLRQGFSENVLSLLFNLSISTVSKNVNFCIDILYYQAKEVNLWPSRFTVQSHMPITFKHNYPSCRVVIDCTEFYVQTPSNPKTQQASWSNYKNHNTYKSLIGMLPSGAICFISELWLGNISDKELTLKCGILDKLESGDLVLADRGFTVLEPEFSKRNISLETPYFLSNKIQFDVSERSENKKVSHHRVHVERAIGRMKNFQILNNIIPATLKSIDKIHYICAFLCNFSEEPLISSSKFK